MAVRADFDGVVQGQALPPRHLDERRGRRPRFTIAGLVQDYFSRDGELRSRAMASWYRGGGLPGSPVAMRATFYRLKWFSSLL